MNAARWRLGLVATSLSALLAACGGGSGQIEPFKPTRMLNFGDENSVLLPDGRRHSISDFKRITDGTQGTVGTVIEPKTIDCTAFPIWTQQLATQFGLVMAACNPLNAAVTVTPYAAAGAKVADVKAQIDQHLASGTVGPKDLITVMVGQNDILELYAQYPTKTEQQLRDELTQRGRDLADQVNRLAAANGRVLVLTLPDLGSSPFALAEKAAKTDTDRAALLSRLTEAFNVGMRLRLLNDGRLIGLVLADELIAQSVKFPSAFNLANVTGAACTTALPNCTVDTLFTDATTPANSATAVSWLWADATHLSPAGQSRLGSGAVQRAVNNPF